MGAEEVYELPAIAVSTLSDEGLLLELHGISISHYCLRAKLALHLAGLAFNEVRYLPLAHVIGIKRLQKRFHQGPGAATASSKSPVATPVLAIYSSKGMPLCLLSNSALISRYAALRAKALGLPATAQLYGPSLALAQPAAAAAATSCGSDVKGSSSSGGSATVVGSGELYETVSSVELRLSGTMGIEVRRVMYHQLLPRVRLGGRMFAANASGLLESVLSPLTYLLCRLLLPKALAINAATATRGRQRLLEEFDFFDSLLMKQQQQQQEQEQPKERVGKGAAAGLGAGDAASSSRLPYYLSGAQLSAADVSLACLAGYAVGVPASQLGVAWTPAIDDMPQEMQEFMKSLRDRPTGKFILELWRVHGPFLHPN